MECGTERPNIYDKDCHVYKRALMCYWRINSNCPTLKNINKLTSQKWLLSKTRLLLNYHVRDDD